MHVAFVTGSNKGIGCGIVKRLAKHYGSLGDWDIYLTARNSELGKETVDQLLKDGYNVKFHQLDITDVCSRRTFLNFMKSNYPGGINNVINNAGIAYKDNSTAPFSEQARVTVYTNFTCTLEFTEEFIPHLADNARVVNVSSIISLMTLKALSSDLYNQFTSAMTLPDLRKHMSDFVNMSENGKQNEHGWPTSSYGVSKLGLTKASYILGAMYQNDPRNIVINSCCPGYVDTDMTGHNGTKTIDEGADTPFYLATLPINDRIPRNEFVYDRKVLEWNKDTNISF